MKIKEIYNFLTELAPLEKAMPYDNAGFLIGDLNNEVTSALVVLDCTCNVVEKAVEQGANLIITHHPIIYNPLKKITAQENKRIYDCIANGITVISMHTNLDVVENGVNDALASALNLKNVMPITDEEGFTFKYGILNKEISAEDFARQIKATLGGVVRYVDANKPIKTVAVCGGSGSTFCDLAMRYADCLVTADVKHSAFIDASQKGFILFDVGHFHSENVIVNPLAKKLSEKFEGVNFEAVNEGVIKTF